MAREPPPGRGPVEQARFSWIGAQARFLVALSALVRMPALAGVVERVTAEPRAQEISLGGVPTTLVRPGSRGPWPAAIFVNGVTARGRRHPDVQRFANGLARAGYLTLVPDLPGLREGELTDGTVDATVTIAMDAAGREDVLGSRVGLVGVSLGASVALLAAEDPRIADSVSVAGGLAPYTSLVNVFRLATTGTYPEGGRLIEYRASETLTLVVARSLVAALPQGGERRRLFSLLPEIADEVHEPLGALRTLGLAGLGPEAKAVVELLVSREPARFDRLYAALPARMQAAVERLSPLAGAGRLHTPVELVSAPHDKYFPLAESRALTRVAPRARLTVTSALAHADLRLSPGALADLARLDAFGVRVLHALSRE